MRDSFYPKYVSYLLSGLIVALVTLTSGISHATTYYVAKTGNDSNQGTANSPFRNIKHGVSKLSAGDTLYVKAGTYYESILSWQTPIPNGTSWENPVTVSANPGDTVRIEPPSGHAFFWVKDGKAKYLIINGFIVDGKDKAMHGFKFSDNTRFIRITNTEVMNTSDSGILVTLISGAATSGLPENTYHEFINMKVHDNGSSGFDHGFYVSTSYNLFEKNEVYNNAGFGIHLYMSQFNTANHNIVRHTKAYNNGKLREWACGILISSGDNNAVYNNIAYGNPIGFCSLYRTVATQFYNNIAYNNTISGFHVGEPSNIGSEIYNNTIHQNGSFGIYVGDGAKNSKVQNNISFQNIVDQIFLKPEQQTGTILSHNLTNDPKFMNAVAKDFHIKEGSPAIDAGLAINVVTTDYDGLKRDQGEGPDIGAYEAPHIETDTEAPKAPIGILVY